MSADVPATTPADLARMLQRLDQARGKLAEAPPFAKPTHVGPVLDTARRLLPVDGGVEGLYERIPAIDKSGLFAGTDWDKPELLQPHLVAMTLSTGDQRTVTIECLSALRWLAIASGDYRYPGISPEYAEYFIRKVLALNLDYVFERETEVARDRKQQGIRNVFRLMVDRIGYGDILEQVVAEIWRILRQRPINVSNVTAMVTKVAVYLNKPDVAVPRGADRLVSALYGPTHASQHDPGIQAYAQSLETMDAQTLHLEGSGFARAMHDTGLVSPYHAVYLRFLLAEHSDLVPAALGLSSTGTDVMLTYRSLVLALIDEAIFPETCQAIYGLASLLERGILYSPPVAPSLWRQIQIRLQPQVREQFFLAFGDVHPPRVHLLAGLLSLLGQPLGVGQGQNPTCQSARAISMWAYNDPDYLLQLVTWAGRDGEIVMRFEDHTITSKGLQAGLAATLNLDLDPVSLLLVPHLDRIYMEMGRLAVGRGEDPHKWVNPAFHGWWVSHGFAIAVDVATGLLKDYENFVRRFYAVYNPYYNGNQPLVHPQPAGVAVTDSMGRFVGWHAISITRVAIDPEKVMRVYFYNPNNDSGQDWGCGVKVSTEQKGEYYGEASLPFSQFTSRLYIFHYDPLETVDLDAVPAEKVADVRAMAAESWARERVSSA